MRTRAGNMCREHVLGTCAGNDDQKERTEDRKERNEGQPRPEDAETEVEIKNKKESETYLVDKLMTTMCVVALAVQE